MLFHIVYTIKLPQVHEGALESHTIDIIKLPHVHKDSLESHGFEKTSSITNTFTVQLRCFIKLTSELQKHLLN